LEKMGHTCIYIAGSQGVSDTPCYIIEELRYRHPLKIKITDNCYKALIDYSEECLLLQDILAMEQQIEIKLIQILREQRIDLLIVNNIWSLGWDLAAGIAFYNAVKATDIACIAHHHDFFWERELYQHPTCSFVKDMLEQYFPPKDARITHCVINKIAGEALQKRRGITAQVVPNVFDFAAPPWKKDEYNSDIRARCGIKANDIVFLQATRICERKGLELAIATLSEVNRRKSQLLGKTLYNGQRFMEENQIWYLLAGMDEDVKYYHKILKYASCLSVPIKWIGDVIGYSRKKNPNGNKIYSLWDSYTMADFVTYPSLLEGWGNQLLEGVFAEKPELIYEYPVYRTDIADKKFDFVSLGHQAVSNADDMKSVSCDVYKKCANEIIQILTNTQQYRQIVDHNLEVGKKYFSYQQLYTILEKLLSFYSL
ncbi:MAG: glycosyltransferase, group 1 family protein, partial [Clostridiales bacterium]|nr:glycosyltransferase, group 1 family protein [Clostridiales bacterium]